LKLIFEVSDAPLPNRLSAGVPATVVDLVRSGRTPEELAREFEPTAQSISTWVKQADRDAGKRIDGPTSAEREELARLRRENHRLRQERDILAKAAAWFARESKASPNGFTGSSPGAYR
jgi:transposase